METAESSQARAHRSSVASSFDQRASTYEQSAMHRAIAEAVADFAPVDQGDAVLDVGTGTGLALRAIVARTPRVRLIGVDISTGMLHAAHRSLRQGVFVVGCAEHLPFRDEAIDLVMCVTAMHLLGDPSAALSEFARVLKPGGRAVLATFASSDDSRGANRPYRTNHRAFESIELVAAAAQQTGLTVHRDAKEMFDGHPCVLAELRRESALREDPITAALNARARELSHEPAFNAGRDLIERGLLD